jgi:hypothetical protein
MVKSVRGQAVALLLILVSAGHAYAQQATGSAATPVPAPAPACPPAWHLDPLALYASVYPTGHGADCAAGPAACIPYEDRNGPLLIGDPLLDNGPATPGWLAAVELGFVVPRLQDTLKQPVTLPHGLTDFVALPNTPLGVNAMPTLTFGYRLPQAAGDFTVSYRFVVAAGSQTIGPTALSPFAPPGPAALRSRLNLQVLDIDYGNYEPSLGPQWDMKWRIGVRGVMNYSDNQATGVFVAQQSTNRFWGIGPHAALDLRRWIADSGFAWFGRLDTSLPIGRVAQRYIDVTALGAGETRLFENNPVLSLNAQCGLAWSPKRCDNFRITGGYTWEHWWDTGAIGVQQPFPRQQFNIQGGFLRAEWNY